MRITKIPRKTDHRGYLQVRIPTSLPEQDVEVLIITRPVKAPSNTLKPYDFTRLAGRLAWKGDPLKEQKALRDKW